MSTHWAKAQCLSVPSEAPTADHIVLDGAQTLSQELSENASLG